MADPREFDLAVVGVGGLGSAAVYWGSRRGLRVLGLERFELGHERGASQDHSRLIRLSYHTPAYVGFAKDAYSAWSAVELDAGEQLIIPTGGVDLYPAGAAISIDDYSSSLDVHAVAYEVLDAAETIRRWPQFRLADDVRVMFQADTGVVAAAKCNEAHRRMALERGTTLVDDARVTGVRDVGGEYELTIEGGGVYRAERLIVTADAWTNDVLAGFDYRMNLTVTQEQVAYFASPDLEAFAPGRFPVWIWMDDPSFYGLPAYGEAGAKIGQDVGGREVTGDTRSFEPDPDYHARLESFLREHVPGALGPLIKAKTCLYAMTPDRDFVLDFIPGQRRAVVGQGAAHAFKFASVYGKSLVELVCDGETESDISAFTIDREVLTMQDPPRSFIV